MPRDPMPRDPAQRDPAQRDTGAHDVVRTFAWAALVAAIVAALLPAVLTDGDSCMNAALARDVATGDGWRAWVAPQWAQGGAWTWYREHTPGSYWCAALLQMLGLSAERAPLVANALWMVASAAGVAAIVRTRRQDAAPLVAGVVLLLHVAALKYVQRVSIEFPLAACTAWTLAGALRLRHGRRWVAITAAALGGAFLVRGVFGAVAAALFVGALIPRDSRPPFRRWIAAAVLAAVPVLLFDRLHAAATGTPFSVAYFERQIASSFAPGGTQHTGSERQFGYFALRLVLYSLPWSLLPIWRARRGPREPRSRALGPVLFVGVGISLLGASLTMRPASRYLFGAWPCLAALFGLALPRPLPAVVARYAVRAFVVLTPLLLIGKGASPGGDEWKDAAADLAVLREGAGAPTEVRGRFDPQDARDKAFLRWHLGARALGGDVPHGRADVWRIVRRGESAGNEWVEVASTPFGSLVAPR